MRNKRLLVWLVALIVALTFAALTTVYKSQEEIVFPRPPHQTANVLAVHETSSAGTSEVNHVFHRRHAASWVRMTHYGHWHERYEILRDHGRQPVLREGVVGNIWLLYMQWTPPFRCLFGTAAFTIRQLMEIPFTCHASACDGKLEFFPAAPPVCFSAVVRLDDSGATSR